MGLGTPTTPQKQKKPPPIFFAEDFPGPFKNFALMFFWSPLEAKALEARGEAASLLIKCYLKLGKKHAYRQNKMKGQKQ